MQFIPLSAVKTIAKCYVIELNWKDRPPRTYFQFISRCAEFASE